MTLKPKNGRDGLPYPSGVEYARGVRQALALLAVAGSSAVIDDAAAAEPPRDVKKVSEAKKKPSATDMPEAAKKLLLENIRKEVQANAEKLGSDGFKKRREATKRLIAIGSITEKAPSKPGVAARKERNTRPYRDMVKAEMEKLLAHKDPEVKERAKLVITALTPKLIPKGPPMAIDGDIAVEPLIEEQW